MALGVNVDTPGHVELTGTATRRAPLGKELALFGELLHTVVQAIHHAEVIVRIEGHTRGTIEFPSPSPWCPPLAYPTAIPGEDGDTVVPLIADVDIAGLVKCNRRWPHEGTIGRVFICSLSRNAAAKLGDVLLVSHGADGNALAIRPALIGAIEH